MYTKQKYLFQLATQCGLKSSTVQHYQNQIIKSFNFRLFAVKITLNAGGACIQGIDQKIIKNDFDKLNLINSLINLESYKIKPVKWICINKCDKKLFWAMHWKMFFFIVKISLRLVLWV